MSAADLLAPEQTADEVRESLDMTQKGQTANTIRNCKTVFQHDPLLRGAVRYNLLTERIDIVKPLWWSKPTTTLNDTDLNYLMLYLEDQYTLTSEKKIPMSAYPMIKFTGNHLKEKEKLLHWIH